MKISITTSRSERRRKPRKRPLTLVYVELPAANGGMMRDLSEEGFAMRAMMPLRADESTSFVFSLTDKLQIEGQGLIEWVADGGHVAGVKFTDLSAAARREIRDWLNRPETPECQEKPAAKEEATLEQLREEIHSVPPRPEGTHSMPAQAETAVREPEVAEATHEEPEERPSVHVVPPQAAAIPEQPVTVAEQSHPAVETHVPVPKETPTPEQVFAKPVHAGPHEEPLPSHEEVAPPAEEVTEVAEAEVPAAPEIQRGEPSPSVASMLFGSAPAEDAAVEPPALIDAPNVLSMHAARTEETSDTVAETGAPELPWLTLTPKAFDSTPRPVSEPSMEETAPSQTQYWKPITSVTETAASEPAPPEPAPPEPRPVLPDISEVLIQPSGRAQKPVSHLEALPKREVRMAPETAEQRFSLAGVFWAMAILALLAGLFVFHRNVGRGLIWLGEALGGAEQQQGEQVDSNAARPAEAKPVQPQATSQRSTPSLETETPETAPVVNPAPHGADTPPPATGQGGGNVPVASNEDPGQAEYTQAMQLLQGPNANAARPEALRLLWISVEKGNSNAELELAQMYWRGQGVTKNCDQALILLTASARKGNTEAQRQVLEFQKQGCG